MKMKIKYFIGLKQELNTCFKFYMNKKETKKIYSNKKSKLVKFMRIKNIVKHLLYFKLN